MRIAFFSPLNPKRSGISDYSEEMLAHLKDHASIDLVVDGYEPTTPWLKNYFGILTPPDFLKQRESYDAVVYQVGNSHQYHAYMLECMRLAPGIVVLHDYSLSYLMLGVTAARGDLHTLRKILEPTHGDHAPRMARQLLLGGCDPYESSLARPVIEMSRGVIVHNQFAQQRLEAEYPGKPVRKIWHPTPFREPVVDVNVLRNKLGLAQDDFVLASVSQVAYNKRFDLVLRVLRKVVEEYPQVRLLVVSGGQFGSRVESLIRSLRLQKHVIRTGWVSSDDYLGYIDAADACIDLRYPTAGETSGSSLRVLQAGKPIVASATGFFLELPDDAWIKVPVGAGEEERAVSAVKDLIRNPELKLSTGQSARNFVLQNLGREHAARAYIEFVNEIRCMPKGELNSWCFRRPYEGGTQSRTVKALFHAGRLAKYVGHYGPFAALRRIGRGSGGA